MTLNLRDRQLPLEPQGAGSRNSERVNPSNRLNSSRHSLWPKILALMQPTSTSPRL